MEVGSLTWKECEETLKRIKTVILPFGSLEEHGFHLPLNTDTTVAWEIARRVAEKRDVLVLPPIFYGICRTTNEFPGTITLSFETTMKIVEEILEETIDQGVEKVILLTGHWGKSHIIALREASLKIKRRYPLVEILLVPYPELADRETKSVLETEREEIGHAGEFETSIMLVLRPSLVKMEKAEGESPHFPRFATITSGRNWMKTGVMGEPKLATKEKGEILLSRIVENLARLI